MKKNLLKALSLTLIITSAAALSACTKKESSLEIALPNDTTNEARALLLLKEQGLISLKEGAGISATILDIKDNPHNIKFREVEAAQLPNILQDVDFAVINSNFAIDSGLNPSRDALVLEGSYSAYANILAVKKGKEKEDKIKALVAAVESKEVADFISEKYAGSVVSVVTNPTDGYDPSIDYAKLKNTKISVAASPTPHSEILKIAQKILAAKNIELKIQEFTDYVLPNKVVDSGELDANFFQHLPYLEDFNKEQGTDLVSVSAIHVEPMGLYGGKQTSLDGLK